MTKTKYMNAAIIFGVLLLLVLPACAVTPVITGTNPNTGLNNTNPLIVSISGSNFPVYGDTVVRLNKTGQSNISVPSFSYISGNLICNLDLTGAQFGPWNVVVINTSDGSEGIGVDNFTVYNNPPTLSGISPPSGVNTDSAATFTVSGSNFLPGAIVNLTRPTYTTITALVSSYSSGSISGTFNLSSAANGTWYVNVTNPDGNLTSEVVTFDINWPAPTISGYIPSQSTNNGPQSMTINGNNFRSDSIAYLNKTGYADIYPISMPTPTSNQMIPQFNLNGVPVGSWNVVVQNSDGQTVTATPKFLIFYPAAPAINNISPSTGVNTNSLNGVLIGGSGFQDGATVVLNKTLEADIPATSVVVNNQSYITCTLPITGASTGAWNIIVTNNDTQTNMLPSGFTITTPPAPTASFTAVPTTGPLNLNVQFNDTSINAPDTWNWSFGDGAYYNTTDSSQRNTTHSYATAGTWSAQLTVSNAYGSSTSAVQTITISPPPTANFTYSPANGFAPLHVFFSDTSVTAITGRLWHFGIDEYTATSQNPDFTYYNPGSYTVNLTVTNASGTSSIQKTVLVTTKPVANFTGSPTSGSKPLSVNFTDSSTNATGWYWDFGDGSNSTLQNPDHTYSNVGTYTVSLTPSNAGGNGDPLVKTSYISVLPQIPVASFMASPVTGTTPLLVVFNDTSSNNPTSWLWNFGDGYTSTEQNTTHTFTTGTWVVNLTATNSDGSNTTVPGTTITVNPAIPEADFTASTYSGIGPLTVNFTDTSLNAPTAWNWSFGDGTYSSLQNPSKVFDVGIWNVTLTASNSAGSDTTLPVAITVTATPVPPVADFTATPTAGFKPLYVQFSDASSSDITSWLWKFGYDDFGAGTQNPDYTYNHAGNYTVNLTVTNASGTNTLSKTGYIIVTNKPVSNFTATPTSGIRPLTVDFTDLSTDATGWYWDFGDGSNSTEQNPQHVYLNEGTYSVSLTAKNSGGNGDTVVKIDYITARIPGPVASFTAAPTSGYIPLVVQFNDTSINVPTSWNWDFGDYSSSSVQNPSHTYTTPGVYTVRLEVSNAGGSNTSVMPNLINATQPKPVAEFTGYPANGTATETEFHFFDLSTNNPTSWLWNFGDGTTSTSQNATHIYQTANSYYVSLTATNAGGSDTETKGPIVVKNPRAIANFTGTPTLGSVPLTVQFTDTSSNFPTTWRWDFGDNTFALDIRNPVHTYNKAGTYNVTLMVQDQTSGTPASTLTRTAYVTVVKTPIAAFSATPTSGNAPLFVSFTDQSQGSPFRYYWKFGDGATSTAKNPTHYYKKPGVYTVTETVQNGAGFNTTVKQNYITVTELPQASFIVNATSGTAPKTIKFTDTSTGVPNTWSWDFGDGSSGSSEQNPVHTYYSSGVYSVQLVVSNAMGSSTATKPSLINIGTPTGADFTFKPAEGDVPLMIQFTDNSAGGPILIYKWQFGDGYVSKEKNPVHTYMTPGNYTVTLTITTNTGAVSSVSKEVVLTGTPVASFKANPTGGSSPLTVQFTDTSSNAPTTWFWTFGDGTFGNVKNPVHTYNSAGTYNVKLFVSNSYGNDQITYPALISVSQFP